MTYKDLKVIVCFVKTIFLWIVTSQTKAWKLYHLRTVLHRIRLDPYPLQMLRSWSWVAWYNVTNIEISKWWKHKTYRFSEAAISNILLLTFSDIHTYDQWWWHRRVAAAARGNAGMRLPRDSQGSDAQGCTVADSHRCSRLAVAISVLFDLTDLSREIYGQLTGTTDLVPSMQLWPIRLYYI